MRFWDVPWESLAIAAEYASNSIQGPVFQNLMKLLGNVTKKILYTLILFAEKKKKKKKNASSFCIAFATQIFAEKYQLK